MKRYQRKGFTLLELIIVIALFSIIMVSVVKLLDPVSKFHVRSANFETTNACVDNMRRTIEGNLKYADRVRVYSGFEPYEYKKNGDLNESTYAPTTTLTDQVEDFYNEFFTAAGSQRKFLDSVGSIYVLVFDNTEIVSDSGLKKFALLSEIQSNSLNRGKMVRYEFKFDNYKGGLCDGAATITPFSTQAWYVNKDLYGNFEYRFSLGAFDAGSLAVSPFDPSDCTISITMNEIKKSKDGLVRATETKTNTASFSMKNVLDAAAKYTKPLNDFVMTEDPTKSGAQILDRFVIEDVPIPRFKPMVPNAPAAFDGFYFIYTMPETTYDLMDFDGIADYSAEVAIAKDYLTAVHDYEVANGIT